MTKTKTATVEMRTKEISNEETVEKIINYIRWCMYCNPQDENERGYNRWIERAIRMVEDYIETFQIK